MIASVKMIDMVFISVIQAVFQHRRMNYLTALQQQNLRYRYQLSRS